MCVYEEAAAGAGSYYTHRLEQSQSQERENQDPQNYQEKNPTGQGFIHNASQLQEYIHFWIKWKY